MKIALALLLTLSCPLASAQSFTPATSMSVARAFHSATVLQDGRIFIVGGSADTASEIYDPATRTFRRSASMRHARNSHTATLLLDGRVLIAGGNAYGGDISSGTQIDGAAEVFDPRTETFTPTGPMVTPRYGHSAALLSDGKVLLTGGGESYVAGFSIGFRPQAHAEIFDPATNTFSALADMQTARWNHTSTRLGDGSVLIVGSPVNVSTAAAELFDPQTRTFRAASGSARRALHTATMLRDGRVLIAGGGVDFGIEGDVFSSSSGAFQHVSAPSNSSSHTETLLRDGRVLLTGWSAAGTTTNAAAIYDPASGQISFTAPMMSSRLGQRASLLPDGSALITGGNGATTEIFTTAAPVFVAKRRIVGR
jgi:WD40 repeat protein